MSSTAIELVHPDIENVKTNESSFSPALPLHKELKEFALDVLPNFPTVVEEHYRMNLARDWVVTRTRVSRVPEVDKKLYFRADYDPRFLSYTSLLTDSSFDYAANMQFGEFVLLPGKYGTLKAVKEELERRLGIRFVFIPTTPEKQKFYSALV